MQKIRPKSPIHANADANITCDFGDGDISRCRSRLPHTCTHTRTHSRAHTRTYTRARAHTHTRARVRIHTHTRARIHTRTHARTHAHTNTASSIIVRLQLAWHRLTAKWHRIYITLRTKTSKYARSFTLKYKHQTVSRIVYPPKWNNYTKADKF